VVVSWDFRLSSNAFYEVKEISSDFLTTNDMDTGPKYISEAPFK
jgi:hypothetical protein